MIRKDIYIAEWDWTIHAFFAVTEYWVDEIMDLLWDMECDSEHARRAYENLTSGELNTGLCYSNYTMKRSVMVIAKTSSAEEFFNSYIHEACHLQSHVCNVYNLSPSGEEIAYFIGEISRDLFPHIKHLLCDCCRTEYIEDYE